ncbi:MAG: hypothetical protein Q8R31_04560 [Candidatus Omnitrophota bacterium]|nr:hypothetical protein [Candidatus Omnitrophota bacterium]
MEENIKNRIVLILAILSIIFFMGAIRSCSAGKKLKMTLIELDKEKSVSWDSEQKINELKKEKAALSKELEDSKSENEITKKALLQEQLVNESLKEELQKVSELKNTLEDDLKDALVKDNTKLTK